MGHTLAAAARGAGERRRHRASSDHGPAADPRIRLVEAPEQFDALPYGMIWHPRLDSDPAHGWLREMIRTAAREMVDRPR